MQEVKVLSSLLLAFRNHSGQSAKRCLVKVRAGLKSSVPGLKLAGESRMLCCRLQGLKLQKQQRLGQLLV